VCNVLPRACMQTHCTTSLKSMYTHSTNVCMYCDTPCTTCHEQRSPMMIMSRSKLQTLILMCLQTIRPPVTAHHLHHQVVAKISSHRLSSTVSAFSNVLLPFVCSDTNRMAVSAVQGQCWQCVRTHAHILYTPNYDNTHAAHLHVHRRSTARMQIVLICAFPADRS
jgi:hypothetical protein